MDSLRSRVAKKAAKFVQAQQAPAQAPVPPPPGGAPAAPPKPAAPAAPGGAPMPPPAPAAPPVPGPRDLAEQNVQKKIEDEKRQEQQVTKLQETVDKNNQALETLVDAVVQLKQVIEKGVLGEPDMEDKFKELQEEKEEEKDRKVSPENFGMDKRNLIVSKKEERMDTAAREKLRQARKQRLAKELKYHGEGYDPKGLEYHDAKPEEKKYKQEVPTPVITKFKDDEIPDIFKTVAMDLADDESSWSVVNKTTEEVLYVLPKTEANAEGFGTKAFALAVIADMRKLGLEEAMKKHQAMPFPLVDKDKEGPKPKLKEMLEEKKEEKAPFKLMKKGPEKEEEKEEKKEKLFAGKQEANNFQRRFMRAFRLALAAQQKNLINNPLKAAFFQMLSELNVAEPAKLIEAAFAKASVDQFETAIAKTEEFLGMNDESFIDIESSIGGLETSVPEVDDEPRMPTAAAQALRDRAKRASMMFTTASESDVNDRSQSIAQALPTPKLAGISRLARQI